MSAREMPSYSCALPKDGKLRSSWLQLDQEVLHVQP